LEILKQKTIHGMNRGVLCIGRLSICGAIYRDQPRLSHPPCQFYFDTKLWITLLITCG